jgi:nitroreductase
MKAIEALHTRNSAPRLTGDVSTDTLEEILKAGLRAPDHAQLRPWRIVVIKGEARAALGELFARAKLTSDHDHPAEKLAKLKSKPLRAPVIIAVAAKITEHPKVPEVEQLLSAGAVVQNMLIAAHALGLGAMWRTGGMAYDHVVKEGLGFEENDQIVGFLYLGEIDGRVKPLPDLSPGDFVSHWRG